VATRILVIEDNPANMELVRYVLEAFGYAVIEAIDGETGLELARAEPPDLVICDLELPGIDGIEVAKQLKAHPALAGVPLVAVTAFAMVGDRERLLAAGFDGYISKPLDPQTFVPQIAAFIKSPRPRRSIWTCRSLRRPIQPARCVLERSCWTIPGEPGALHEPARAARHRGHPRGED
jgi:CheY-like chemotaxis protein